MFFVFLSFRIHFHYVLSYLFALFGVRTCVSILWHTSLLKNATFAWKNSEKPWFWRFLVSFMFLTWRHLWRHCDIIQGMIWIFWYQWTREGHSYPLVPHMFHRSVTEILRGAESTPSGCEMGQNNPALLGLNQLKEERKEVESRDWNYMIIVLGIFDHYVSLLTLNCQGAKQKSKIGIITDFNTSWTSDTKILPRRDLVCWKSIRWVLSTINDTTRIWCCFIMLYKVFKVVSNADITDGHSTSFEYCSIVFTCGSKCFTVVTIYRPYPSAKSAYTLECLWTNSSSLCRIWPCITKRDLVIAGDLNLHLNIHNDPSTQRFGELMTTLGHEQSVIGPNHTWCCYITRKW